MNKKLIITTILDSERKIPVIFIYVYFFDKTSE
jgi:hypothetical protein